MALHLSCQLTNSLDSLNVVDKCYISPLYYPNQKYKFCPLDPPDPNYDDSSAQVDLNYQTDEKTGKKA